MNNNSKNLYINDSRVKNDIFTLNEGLFSIQNNQIIFKMITYTINGTKYNDPKSFSIDFDKPITIHDNDMGIFIDDKYDTFDDYKLVLYHNNNRVDYNYMSTNFIDFLKEYHITDEKELKVAFSSLMSSFILWFGKTFG